MIAFELPTSFSRTDRRRYRQKVLRSLDVFAQMLDSFQFDEDKRMIGLARVFRNTEFVSSGDPKYFQLDDGTGCIRVSITS